MLTKPLRGTVSANVQDRKPLNLCGPGRICDVIDTMVCVDGESRSRVVDQSGISADFGSQEGHIARSVEP